MLTFVLDESFSGYLRAGLTGLGGAFTGGSLSAYYDASKERAAAQAAALKSGRPEDMYDADNTVKRGLYTGLGSIPLVGAVSNVVAYGDRMDAEKKAGIEGSFGRAYPRS